MTPAQVPARMSSRVFEVRCAEVHPVRCEVSFRSTTPEDAVLLAREHGARAHGYTPVWYSPRRLASMAAQVTQRFG